MHPARCAAGGASPLAIAAHRRSHVALIGDLVRRLALPWPSHLRGDGQQSDSETAGAPLSTSSQAQAQAQSADNSTPGRNGAATTGSGSGGGVEYKWEGHYVPPPSPAFPFVLVRTVLATQPLRRPSLLRAGAPLDPADWAQRRDVRGRLLGLLADAGVPVAAAVLEPGVDPLDGLGFGGGAVD